MKNQEERSSLLETIGSVVVVIFVLLFIGVFIRTGWELIGFFFK